MAAAHPNTGSKSINIPCILNRASLGNADYVFVVLRDLLDPGGKVAWVPRRDICVEEQPLIGGELKGRLTVQVKEEVSDRYLVTIVNSGVEETILVRKSV